LTCFHSFYPTEYGKKYLDILFLYLNTNFAKNLFDREKREYGNGLEKFEPNDINKSLILNFEIISKKDIDTLKKLQTKLLNNVVNERAKLIKEADLIFKSYLQSA
jgi:adenine-specific DNA-methyltransferase